MPGSRPNYTEAVQGVTIIRLKQGAGQKASVRRRGVPEMAVRKAGSRRIVVDGALYLWRFPRRPDLTQQEGWPGVSVAASRADCPRASVLLLVFPRRFHLSGPVGQEPPRPVLPSEVAAGIRAALAAGWAADQPGKLFVLRAVGQDAEPAAALDWRVGYA